MSPVNNPKVTQGGIVQWIISLFLSDLLGLAPCGAVVVGDELLNFLTGDIFAPCRLLYSGLLSGFPVEFLELVFFFFSHPPVDLNLNPPLWIWVC